MERTITYTVDVESVQCRGGAEAMRNRAMSAPVHDETEKRKIPLGPWLRAKGVPERLLAQLKRTPGGLLHGGMPARTSDLLQPGDTVTIHWTEQPEDKIPPADVPFRVVYEDEDILVVDKPAGVPVHPAVGNHGNTLANGVAAYAEAKGEAWVFRCINRLDRNTGGLVLLAKNALAGAVLSRQMTAREIRRTYQALVIGHTPEEGTVDAPIARKPGSIIEREVSFASGDPAVTHFRAIGYGQVEGLGECTLLELHLDTGRTHQIRVHMSWLGYPLAGDGLYGTGGRTRMSQGLPVDEDMQGQATVTNDRRPDLPGHALHSCRLEFRHPVTGERMRFESRSGFDEWIEGTERSIRIPDV